MEWLWAVPVVVLNTAFFGGTAYLAARLILGPIPPWQAGVVGVVPGIGSIAVVETRLALPVIVLADLLAIYLFIADEPRRAAIITGIHVVFSVALTVAGYNLLTSLGLA